MSDFDQWKQVARERREEERLSRMDMAEMVEESLERADRLEALQARCEELEEEIERLNARLDGGVEGSTYIDAEGTVAVDFQDPCDWPIGTRVRVIREEGE